MSLGADYLCAGTGEHAVCDAVDFIFRAVEGERTEKEGVGLLFFAIPQKTA